VIWINGLALALAICAISCVVLAALIPTSSIKGRIRLAGSLLVGAAFLVASLSQALAQGKPILFVVGLMGGAFLVWLGLRKYRRDPQGRTRPDQIL